MLTKTEDPMAQLAEELKRQAEAISLRKKARLGLLDQLNSRPIVLKERFCKVCKKPQGGIHWPVEGRTIGLICPFRQDEAVCKLVRIDRAKYERTKDEWLINRGVAQEYRKARIEEVMPAIQPQVKGYLHTLGTKVRQGQGLWLSGSKGTGKSSVLGIIASTAYDRGIKDFQWVTGRQLHQAFLEKSEADTRNLWHWRRCTLLLLDDWLPQYASDFSMGAFSDFIEQRQANHLATCLASDMSFDAVKEDLRTARTYDRLRTRCWALTLDGPSRRKSLEAPSNDA